MKKKKIIKKIEKKLIILGFENEYYEQIPNSLEEKTLHYKNDIYDIYIHRYKNSFRFFIRNNDYKEIGKFEIWEDKYIIDKGFKNNTLNNIINKMFKTTMKCLFKPTYL